MRRLICRFSTVALSIAAGCSGAPQMPSTQPNAGSALVRPQVLQRGGSTPNWRTFPLTQSLFVPGIASGPDPALWFTTGNPQGIVRIGMDGARRSVAIPTFLPFALAAGADRRMWISAAIGGSAPELAAATTSGQVTVYPLNSPSGDIYYYTALALGADGNIWLGEMNHLASMSPTGALTEYPYWFGEKDNSNVALTISPDRRYVWYTVCCDTIFQAGGFIGVMDTSTKFLTEWVIQNTSCRTPAGIALGSDGMVYVPCFNGGFGPGVLARLDPRTNVITTIDFNWPLYTTAVDTVRGPDGNVWMATGANGVLARYDIANGAFDFYYTPDGLSPVAAAAGPDGNLWTVAQSRSAASIDVYIRNELVVSPSSATLSGPGATATLQATYTGTGQLAAASKNPAVAVVAPGTAPNSFVVTGRSAGKTTILVRDTHRNSFAVAVDVK